MDQRSRTSSTSTSSSVTFDSLVSIEDGFVPIKPATSGIEVKHYHFTPHVNRGSFGSLNFIKTTSLSHVSNSRTSHDLAVPCDEPRSGDSSHSDVRHTASFDKASRLSNHSTEGDTCFGNNQRTSQSQHATTRSWRWWLECCYKKLRPQY